MSKRDSIPYHGEDSKLHLLYLFVGIASIQMIRFPLTDLFIIVLSSLIILLALVPFFVTLRWDQDHQEDSWCRVVVKRLRDTSFSILLACIALTIMYHFINGSFYLSTFSLYGCLWLGFLLYYHFLYKKLLSLQNVSSSVDAKRWREDWPRDVSILLVCLAVIGVVVYLN